MNTELNREGRALAPAEIDALIRRAHGLRSRAIAETFGNLFGRRKAR